MNKFNLTYIQKLNIVSPRNLLMSNLVISFFFLVLSIQLTSKILIFISAIYFSFWVIMWTLNIQFEGTGKLIIPIVQLAFFEILILNSGGISSPYLCWLLIIPFSLAFLFHWRVVVPSGVSILLMTWIASESLQVSFLTGEIRASTILVQGSQFCFFILVLYFGSILFGRLVNKEVELQKFKENEFESKQFSDSNEGVNSISELYMAKHMANIYSNFAKELNTPITSVLIRLDSISSQVTQDQKELKKEIIVVKRIINQITEIAKSIDNLNFFRPKESKETESLFISEVLNDVIKRHKSKLGINLPKVDIRGENEYFNLIKIRANRIDLGRLFDIGIQNAIDAIIDIKDPWIKVELNSIANRWMEIRIIDSGRIDSSVSEILFKPFVSSRPKHDRVGLGLFYLKEIVKDHNGFVYFDKEAKNTTLCIKLPINSPLSKLSIESNYFSERSGKRESL